MPHCKFIYSGLTVDPNMEIRPCCHVQSNKDSYIKYNQFDFSVETNFPEMAESMKTGWHPACTECSNLEAIGDESPRTKAEENYNDAPAGEYNLIDLKTSNTCNLTCVMCSPGFSSAWVQLLKKNPDIANNYSHLHFQPDEILHWDLDEKILDCIQNAELLKFTGGEPFLIKDVKKICKRLVDSNIDTSTIKLIFNTNGNVTLNNEWYDILNSFDTEIHVSVDGVDRRYEYVRPNGSWSYLESFIGGLTENFYGNITIAAISQALNYIQTDLLRDLPNRWKLKNGQSSVEETLYNPYFLNNSSVNPKLREKYGFTSLHDWDPNNFEKMKKYLERLDQVHNTDFITECPEFEGYNNV
jgi:uncharacterized Fe-S cluster-containing radical SAM superfamily protein